MNHECSKCHCRKKKCALNSFFLGIMAGGIYGMLFAEISGKELRTKLKKSKKPAGELLKAGMDMDMNFFTWLKKTIEEKI